MENLTEAQQQRALKNFVYRQNYVLQQIPEGE